MRGTVNRLPWQSPARHAARQRVLDALDRGDGAVHELDGEDVDLTEEGLGLVRRAATEVMRRLVGLNEGELPAERALALFQDHVFWDAGSGGLILCAQLPGGSVCLPLARRCWALRPRTGPLH